MIVDLAPVAGEAEFGDPALVGEWAAELRKMVASEQIAPWCSHGVSTGGKLVGMGGFKGEPDAGWVEIGYLTFASSEGRGVATATAARLVEIARANGLRGVLAHTLPETNASTRVLAANGFMMAGEVDDPDDGPVWRWEKKL